MSVAGSATSPSMTCAGSPGIIRIRAKTNTATSRSVGTANSTRVERVRIEAKEEQTFKFTVDSEPLLVNFDYAGTLIKELDTCTAKHGDAKMGSFVVFLSDEESLAKQLKEVADKEKLQHTVLAIDNSAGPQNYKVAKDADVTVVLYTEGNVKANFAFKKGEMKEADVKTILASVPKILPEK